MLPYDGLGLRHLANPYISPHKILCKINQGLQVPGTDDLQN